MCVNCNNDGPDFDTILDFLQKYMEQNQKTPEEVLKEKNDDLDKMRSLVIKTYSITDNIRLHLTGSIPQYDVHNLITWIRRLNEVAPASGNVDIYAPYMPIDAPVGPNGEPNLDAATTKVGADGYITIKGMEEDTPHRIMVLTQGMFTSHGSDSALAGNPDDPNWSMPVGAHVSNLYYTVTHEWAHVFDMRPRDEQNLMLIDRRLNIAGAFNPFSPWNSSMSTYGRTAEPEAFAEAFTEWHISKGRTNSFAAKWYAREYNWHQYDNTHNTHNTHNYNYN